MSEGPNSNSEWDAAMRDRLSKLGQKPVDTSGLESRLGDAMDRMSDDHSDPEQLASRASWFSTNRRWAVAALVMLGLGIGWAIVSVSSSVSNLTIDELAVAHEHYLEGDLDVFAVASFAEAKAHLGTIWPEGPELPRSSLGQVEACCVHQMKNCSVSCVHLKYEGKPVTLTVSHLKEAHPPTGEPLQHGGRAMTVSAKGDLRAVSFSESDRCVCVVGSLQTDQLATLARSLRFARLD